MPQRSSLRDVRPYSVGAAAVIFSSFLSLAAVHSAAALGLDFSAALQSLPSGTQVETVHLQGVTLQVAVQAKGSNVAIAFDSAHPGEYPQLGTPNDDFGGPGKGNGGERGEAGENKSGLGNVLVIAEDGSDANADGVVDQPAPDLEDGVIWLSFSHSGYLTFKLINVHDGGTRILAYRDHEAVGEIDASDWGRNSVQTIDLGRFGSVDRVAIDMDGVSAIAAIQLDVPVTGVEASTWAGVKRTYR